jgi:hypothetical protein
MHRGEVASMGSPHGVLGHPTPEEFEQPSLLTYISADLHAMRAAVKRWSRAAGRATSKNRRGKLRRDLRIRGDT